MALAGARPPALLGIASHGVAARADELLEPPQIISPARHLETMAIVVLTVVLSAARIHHTIEFARLRTMI